MVTIRPSPEAMSSGISALVIRMVPMTLVSHIQRQSSSTASATGARPFAPPALLTSTSTRGSTVVNASTESSSVTSSSRAVPPISSARVCSRSRRRAPTTTVKPGAARVRAVASPIPEDAPVTTAIRDPEEMLMPPIVMAQAADRGSAALRGRRGATILTTMASPRGRYSSGAQTRTRLVETAERLFARRGYHEVTLADIRKSAGQHNSSVIAYYFGTKEGLLRAVLAHRLPAVDADRSAVLD